MQALSTLHLRTDLGCGIVYADGNRSRMDAPPHLPVSLARTHACRRSGRGTCGPAPASSCEKMRCDSLGAAQEHSVVGESMGLPRMQEQVALAGGQLAITTVPGHGTRIQIR